MQRDWRRQLKMIIVLVAWLLPLVCVPIGVSLLTAQAQEITTPSDLATEALTTAPTATPAPTKTPSKRAGYALLKGGSTVWKSRQRTSSLGKTNGDAYVWIVNTSVASLTYKIMFDTELSTALEECHTAYVLSADVVWLSDAANEQLAAELAKDEVRQAGGTWIPVISFNYRNPPATPQVTATPTPAPSTTSVPTQEPDLTTGTDLVTPAPTREPDLTTSTDLATAAPTATPALTAIPTVEPTLVPPMIIATPVPDITTGTDLPGDVATGTDLPGNLTTGTDLPALTAAEMKAILDQTHPDRVLTISTTCSMADYRVGSMLTMWAEITGYDGLDYQVIWEVNRGDGWCNAGADGQMSLSFTITEENQYWNWRAGVKLTEIPAP
ncbi:MAG: hypothetical protein IJ438_09155 [Clostridia bacterium]|nr:hypothetical protein [Clostridia bacterium]